MVNNGKRAVPRGLWLCCLAVILGANVAAAQRVASRSVVKGETRSPSLQEREVLGEMRGADLERFVRHVEIFSGEVDRMVRWTYRMRRDAIDAKYEGRIEGAQREADEARADAIVAFEAFLKKYPNSASHTPDAMFRLAELYYDQSYIHFLDGQEAFSAAMERGETPDSLPKKDFDRTINILRDLVARFPSYQNIDGAYYVLGYCLNETAREDEARMVWLASVCANRYQYDPGSLAKARAQGRKEFRPSENLQTEGAAGDGVAGEHAFEDPFEGCVPVSENSRFYFETWWLIGNYHFDYDTSPFGVETSISAYRKLTEDPSHKFYDKGLYKLAWSYFKADKYPQAIEAFGKVVDYTDRFEDTGAGMRPEAIQYLAVCFFTEDWDLDLVPDAVTPLERIKDKSLMPQNQSWTSEVYERLGDILYDNERNETAISVWRTFLKRWPLHLNAPYVQEKIAFGFNKLRQFDDEIVERARLESYGAGSSWWEANREHPLKQAEVARMAREALLESAYYHHKNAQKLKQHGLAAGDALLLEAANAEYERAAGAYRKFITDNPDVPDAYKINFYLADALFWSGQYEVAKVEYVKVRDSNVDDRHRQEAAEAVLYSLEKKLERDVASGRLVVRQSAPEILGAPPVPEFIPMPGLLAELMEERERFIDEHPSHQNAAVYRYQSAQNHYRYGNWDEAKRRYQSLYDTYCTSDPVGIVAWKTLLNMAGALGDIDEKERLALLQQERGCRAEGIDETDTGVPLDELLGDVAMQRAFGAFSKCLDAREPKACLEAGDGLLAAVAKAPSHPSADAALHNGALAFETAGKFETAMGIYGRIVAEYPDSEFTDKSLFKQAFAAASIFEYEKALDGYRILADEKRFADSEYRKDAVYNSAFILTNLQSYKQAAAYWKRYASMVETADKQLEAQFNAADMEFRARRWRRAIGTFDRFIDYNLDVPEAGPLLVKASYRIGQAHQERGGQLRHFIRSWERTVELYETQVNEPGSVAAEYAAESLFRRIELSVRNFESFKIDGGMKRIERLIEQGAEKVQEFESRYRDVQALRRPTWSLAAAFRIGYVYEVYAKSLLAIPPPPLDPETQMLLEELPREDRELVIIEYEERFRQAMEKYVSGAEEKAQKEYRTAIDLARAGNMSNKWTLLALERMNAYDPDTYPRRHNGMVELLTETVMGAPILKEVSP